MLACTEAVSYVNTLEYLQVQSMEREGLSTSYNALIGRKYAENFGWVGIQTIQNLSGDKRRHLHLRSTWDVIHSWNHEFNKT